MNVQNWRFQHFNINFPYLILVNGTGVPDANCMKTGGGSKLTVSDRTSRFECPVATGWC